MVKPATGPHNVAPTSLPTRRPVRRSRRILIAGGLVVIFLIGYYLVSLFQVYATGSNDQATRVLDIGVVSSRYTI